MIIRGWNQPFQVSMQMADDTCRFTSQALLRIWCSDPLCISFICAMPLFGVGAVSPKHFQFSYTTGGVALTSVENRDDPNISAAVLFIFYYSYIKCISLLY